MSSKSFALVSSETLPLTRALAVAHRDMPASPTERTFSDSRAKRLRANFDDGLLLPCQWAKATWKGKDVRMNGQHSSFVLAEMEEIPEGSFVHMDTYKPTSEEGMALLFRQFDARYSNRSSTDCSHAYQGLFEDIAEVDEVKALAAIKGINRYHRFTGEGECFSGDDIGKMFFNKAYYKFIFFTADLLSGKCKELQRNEIIAAVYGTFLQSEERSKEFWRDVKTAAKDDSPSQVLDAQLEKDKDQSDTKKKLKQDQLYGMCVRAWNAYVAGDAPPRGGFNQPPKKALPEIHSV